MATVLMKVGAAIVLVIALLAALVGPALTPFDPAAQELPLRLARPDARASVRPRRARARHPRARARRRAHLVPRRPRRRRASRRSSARCSARSPAISAAWIDDLISRVIDIAAGVSRAAAGHRAGRGARPEPANVAVRADDHRLGRLRAARARPGAARARVRVRAGGARARRATPRVLLRHVVPTAIPAVVVQATLGMAGAIIGEAALSFLGLGVQPPTPSWGTMLNGGPRAPARRAAPDGVSRARDRAAGARLQLPRRRPARPDRSEASGVGGLSRRARLTSSALSASAPSSIAFCSHRPADTGSSRRSDNVAIRLRALRQPGPRRLRARRGRSTPDGRRRSDSAVRPRPRNKGTRRVDRKTGRRQLQHLFSAIGLAVAEQRPSEQRQRVARSDRGDRGALERLDRLVQRRPVVSRLGVLEPHLAERVIDARIVRSPLEGCPRA